MAKSRQCLISFLLILLSKYVLALDNGLSLTPPMGWSTKGFGCNVDCEKDPYNCISELLIKTTIDELQATGLAAAGYNHILLDDCCDKLTIAQRFGLGIQALADYVHRRGLKIGIYENCGNKTCMGFPGSNGYERIDARTFAEWGMDYVTIDGCFYDVDTMQEKFTGWSDLLSDPEVNGDRYMTLSCSWPAFAAYKNIMIDYSDVADLCNTWRYWHDSEDRWESVLDIIDFQEKKNLSDYSGPGAWNDPDVLQIGNGGMTMDEYRAQMSLWAILAAPLILSADIRNLTAEEYQVITNAEVIAVNQDEDGIQGERVSKDGDLEVWARPLHASYTVAAVLLNRGTTAAHITAKWDDLGLTTGEAFVRDLWLRKDIGNFNNEFTALVSGHSAIMITVSQAQSVWDGSDTKTNKAGEQVVKVKPTEQPKLQVKVKDDKEATPQPAPAPSSIGRVNFTVAVIGGIATVAAVALLIKKKYFKTHEAKPLLVK